MGRRDVGVVSWVRRRCDERYLDGCGRQWWDG